MKAWAVKDRYGKFLWCSVAPSLEESWGRAENWIDENKDWLERKGYCCVQVEITEVKE